MHELVSALKEAGPKLAGIVVLWLILKLMVSLEGLSDWMYFVCFVLVWAGTILIYVTPEDALTELFGRLRKQE